MLHTISGDNFHGTYSIRVRAPQAGGIISARVASRIERALCPWADCTCVGSGGTGPDKWSATLIYSYAQIPMVVPPGSLTITTDRREN